MKKLVAALLFLVGLSFSQVLIAVSGDLKGKGIKELFYWTEDVTVVVPRDYELLNRVFKKLLGVSYEDYRLYRFELALDGRGKPPVEVPVEKLLDEAERYKRVLIILPGSMPPKDFTVLKELR